MAEKGGIEIGSHVRCRGIIGTEEFIVAKKSTGQHASDTHKSHGKHYVFTPANTRYEESQCELISSQDAPIKSGLKAAKKSIRMAFKNNLVGQLKNVPSEIVVINERVQLNEDGFTPTEGGNVSFKNEYFGKDIKTPSELNKAKIVFARVFNSESKFSIENPKPPCESNDYGILREGLQNRLEGIRKKVFAKQGSDVYINGLTEQGVRIRKLLDGMDANESSCSDYTTSGSSKKYGVNKLEELNDDQIHIIVRNFAFLVLQSLNPIDGYDDKMTDIDPIDLVTVLNNPDFTQGDMSKFLEDYQARDFKIPTLIGRVLSDTGSQNSSLAFMLEQEKEKMLEQILNILGEGFKNSDEFNAFKQTLDGDSGSKITAAIRWTVDKLKKLNTDKEEQDNLVKNLKEETTRLEAAVADAKKELDDALVKSVKPESGGAAVVPAVVALGAGAALGAAGATATSGPTEKEKALEKKNEDLAELAKTLQDTLDIRTRELEKSKEELTAATKSAEDTNARIVILQETIEQTEKELKNSKLDIDNLKKQIDDLTAEKAALVVQVGGLEAKSPADAEEKVKLQAEIAKLTSLIAASESEVKKIQAEADENKGKFEKEIAGKDAEKAAIQTELTALKDTVADKDQRITRLTESITALTEEKDAAVKDAEKAAETAGTNAAETAAANTKLEKLNEEIDNLKSDLEKARNEHTAATNNLTAATAQAAANNNKSKEEVDKARKTAIETAKNILNGAEPPEDDDAWGEIHRMVSDQKRKASQEKNEMKESIDICYLNYFVGFFMRELRMTTDAKNKIEQHVNAVDDTKQYLNVIFRTLRSGPGARIPSEISGFFKQNSTIDKNIEDVYKAKFHEFYKRAEHTKYDAGDNKYVPYITLFTYFLFFAKKYLIDAQERIKECTLSKYVINGPSVPSVASEDASGDAGVASTTPITASAVIAGDADAGDADADDADAGNAGNAGDARDPAESAEALEEAKDELADATADTARQEAEAREAQAAAAAAAEAAARATAAEKAAADAAAAEAQAAAAKAEEEAEAARAAEQAQKESVAAAEAEAAAQKRAAEAAATAKREADEAAEAQKRAEEADAAGRAAAQAAAAKAQQEADAAAAAARAADAARIAAIEAADREAAEAAAADRAAEAAAATTIKTPITNAFMGSLSRSLSESSANSSESSRVTSPLDSVLHDGDLKNIGAALQSIYKHGGGLFEKVITYKNEPLVKFILNYELSYGSKFFRPGFQLDGHAYVPSKLTDEFTPENVAHFSTIFSQVHDNYRRKFDEVQTIKFIKYFVLNLFKAYVEQTIKEKTLRQRADELIPIFRENLGNATIRSLKNKTIYNYTGLNDAQMKEYAISRPSISEMADFDFSGRKHSMPTTTRKLLVARGGRRTRKNRKST